MEIGGGGGTALAMQLMQTASEVRGQTTQQLQVLEDKVSESQQEVLRQSTEIQSAAVERKSVAIDVMA